ncbi:MAG: Gfo/Idh/MocA family oxidoreductase [Pseudomonadota bacterium]
MYRGVAIGAGYFSQYHYDAWRRLPTAELVAACDLNAELVASVVDRFAIPRMYTNYVEMFDTEKPDFVDIITPPQSHAEICAEAESRGIHVICQKPLAPTFEEATSLVRELEGSRIRFMVHENFRFQPWHREIRRLVGDGQIGQSLHSLSFNTRTGDGWGEDAYKSRQAYFRDYPRLLVYETGVHFIDVFRYLGGEIASVYARLRRLNEQIAGEDCGIVVFNFVNGAVGIWDANRYNEPNYEHPRYTFGEFLVEGDGGAMRLYPDGRLTVQPLGLPEADHTYAHDDVGFAGDCCLATQAHFVRCLDTGEPFETNGPDYLKTLRVQEAIYESAATNSLIAIEAGSDG